MKKILTSLSFFLCLCFSLCLFSCKNTNGLESYVSELRTVSYRGESEEYSLKANYGFKETPFVKDGKVGEKAYSLTIKLLGVSLDPATYYASLTFDEINYKDKFILDSSGGLSVSFEIKDFKENEFDVNIICGNKTQTVKLVSVVPENTLTYVDALNNLKETQSELVSVYYDGEEFNAEIYARILVKEDKPYWYIAFATSNDLKALLIDGFTGEVLAIRNVF